MWILLLMWSQFPPNHSQLSHHLLVILLFIYLKICSLIADLHDQERVMLGLCCHDDKRLVWKAIYFECLSSGKHFLEQVLVGVCKQRPAYK